MGTYGCGKSVKDLRREKKEKYDETIQKSAIESKVEEKADIRKSGENAKLGKSRAHKWPEEKELLEKCDGLATTVQMAAKM